jgi:hypothetical protein
VEIKMDERTLEALKGSIRKWERIAHEGGEDLSFDNCPLCKLFFQNSKCEGCPVAAKVESFGCLRTPYSSAWLPATDDMPTRKADTLEALSAALEEINFLKSLLPV